MQASPRVAGASHITCRTPPGTNPSDGRTRDMPHRAAAAFASAPAARYTPAARYIAGAHAFAYPYRYAQWITVATLRAPSFCISRCR
ncbi:hypothetical protein DM56_210 [Burkholderia mallei]|nr:hypothetical protein DM56_210 [Burkholderia mallei]